MGVYHDRMLAEYLLAEHVRFEREKLYWQIRPCQSQDTDQV